MRKLFLTSSRCIVSGCIVYAWRGCWCLERRHEDTRCSFWLQLKQVASLMSPLEGFQLLIVGRGAVVAALGGVVVAGVGKVRVSRGAYVHPPSLTRRDSYRTTLSTKSR